MINTKKILEEEKRLKKIVFCKCGSLLQETYDEIVECPTWENFVPKSSGKLDKLYKKLETFAEWEKHRISRGVVCTGQIDVEEKKFNPSIKEYKKVKKEYDLVLKQFDKEEKQEDKKHTEDMDNCTQNNLAVWRFIQSIK